MLFLNCQRGSPGRPGSLLALFASSAGWAFVGGIMHLVCATGADFYQLLFGYCGDLIVLWIVKSDKIVVSG